MVLPGLMLVDGASGADGSGAGGADVEEVVWELDEEWP